MSECVAERVPLRRAPLRVAALDDPLEQKAETVADRVMRMPEPTARLIAGCPGGCRDEEAGHHRQLIREEDEVVRRTAVGDENGTLTPEVGSAIAEEAGRGSPLPSSILRFFEPRFGDDFSRVRVHDDATAAHLAASVNARAFTAGQDVFLGSGQWAPGTVRGTRVMAHELAHVHQGADQVVRRMADRPPPTKWSKPKGGETLVAYGGGFDFFASLADERNAVANDSWDPDSTDLQATAEASFPRNAWEIFSFRALQTLLLHQKDNSIRELWILGHANAHALALTGKRDRDGNIRFGNVIDEATLEESEHKAQISRKFVDGARVILVGCNSAEQPDGVREPISKHWSQDGKRPLCVVGFDSTVFWCIQFSASGNVVSRGRVTTDPNPDLVACNTFRRLKDLKKVPDC